MTDFSGGYSNNKQLLTPFKTSSNVNKNNFETSSSRGESFLGLEEGENLEIEQTTSFEKKKSFTSKKLSISINEEIKQSQYEIRGSFIRAGKIGLCTCQVVRSAGLWSYGLENTDCSIQNAYLELIDNAEYFIYIENQFFISNTAGDPVKNRVANFLVKKIISKAQSGQPFKVIVVLPLLPGFAGEVDSSSSAVLRIQMHWQYQTIIRGKNSVYNQLKACEFISNPSDYIKFYGLRTHDVFDKREVTEIVYVHSKVMIIDDREMIIGSANINDRSMVGDHDSEIAMVVSDAQKIPSKLAGNDVKVSQTVHKFRMKIFQEFVGKCKEKDLIDPLSENFVNEWEGTAYKNTAKYREVFGCYPDDLMDSYETMRKMRAEAQKKNIFIKNDEIKGFLVEFPLNFLKNEDLTFSTISVENLLPEKGFI